MLSSRLAAVVPTLVARLVMLVLLVPVVLVLGAPAGTAGGHPQLDVDPPTPRPVVIIGVPGLAWTDIDPERTPRLWTAAEGGAVANLNVRSTYLTACPTDGWLGLSAGSRVAFPRPGSPDVTGDPRSLPHCPAPAEGADLPELPAWGELRAEVERQGFSATPGLLADAVTAAGGCVTATGLGTIAATRSDGSPAPSRPADVTTHGRAKGVGDPGCALHLVGVPPLLQHLRSVTGGAPDAEPHTPTQEAWGGAAAVSVDEVDQRVGEALDAAPEDATVVIAGLSDDGGASQHRAVIVTGQGWPAGLLASDSTGRTGLVQVGDLTALALDELVLPAPEGMTLTGRDLHAVPDDAPFAERREGLVADNAQLVVGQRVIPTFFKTFGYGLLVVALLIGAVWATSGPGLRARLRPVIRWVALAATAVPLGTYLATNVPWWRADSPVLALAAAVYGVAAVVATALLLSPLRRSALAPLAVVAAATALLLTADLVVSSGRMTMLSVLGLQPLDGGRFHGFGNVPFALFATSTFLGLTALADLLVRRGTSRRTVAAVVGGLGVVAFAVDAAPWLGADGGGSLALIPSVGYLVLALAGVRVTLLRAALLAAATVLGFLAMCFVDWLRPESSRTHLGRFFQKILDGGAWQVIERKLQSNVDLLLGPERVALLVPVGLVVIIWLLARPESALARPLRPAFAAHPVLRDGLIALVVALTAGFLLNDSGTAIPGVAAIMLVPGLATVLTGLRRTPSASPSSASPSATAPSPATPSP